MAPLDLTELNRFFNTPRPKPPTKAQDETVLWPSSTRRLDGSAQSSPLSSTSTLAGSDDENVFVWSKYGDMLSSTPDVQADLQDCPILVQHSKYFSDEFLQRAKQDQTWADVQAHLPFPNISDTYSPPEPVTEVSKEFSPYAAPFIPTHPVVAPPTQTATPLGGVPQPPWFCAFWAGAQLSALFEYDKHACALIDHRRWTTKSIRELAQHFCWKGSEGICEESAAVGLFARAVYTRFKDAFGEWHASSFLWQLRAIVFATFRACWQSGPTHEQASVTAVSCALSLCMFIGDLFTQNLLPVAPVYQCITDLLASLSSIEDMHAIHLLLLHTNQTLWLRHGDGNRALKHLVSAITQRAKEAAVNGAGEEVGQWAGEIVGMVQNWQARLFPQLPPGLGYYHGRLR